MVEIGQPLVKIGEYSNAGNKNHYRRVNRFIRHGVDKLMEMTEKENFFFSTCKKPSSSSAQNFRRVACFAAPGVERKIVRPPQDPGDFRHMTCFIASGILKGEGHFGGGTVPSILDIGFNPTNNFNENRIKRQNAARVNQKTDNVHYGIKKSRLRPRDKRTYVFTYLLLFIIIIILRSLEKLWIQKEREEAALDMKEYERRKLKRKEENAAEKRRVSDVKTTAKIKSAKFPIGIRSHSAVQPLGAASCRGPKGNQK